MLILNSAELQRMGYTQIDSNRMMSMLCNTLPYTTATITVMYKKSSKHESRHQVRCVRADEALKLCDDRIETGKRFSRVNVEAWVLLKSKLDKINHSKGIG